VRRDGFPVLFAFELANGAALPTVLALVAGGPVVALGYLGVWYLAEILLIRRAGWPGSWRDLVALPLRDLMLPALWLATFARRGFEWRGTAMGEVTAAE
jgi:ceramide glucosyltransferase